VSLDPDLDQCGRSAVRRHNRHALCRLCVIRDLQQLGHFVLREDGSGGFLERRLF
jgi:hypothetical protein